MSYCIGQEECGCKVHQDHDARVGIVYCPKHESAPDLYEACKVALDYFTEYDIQNKVISGLSLQLNEAIAKAEAGNG